jgi:hypothetical protein
LMFSPPLSFFISPQCIHIKNIWYSCQRKVTFFIYCLLHLVFCGDATVATFYHQSHFLGCRWTVTLA